MKKIISLLLILCFTFSLTIVSYSEDTAEEASKLELLGATTTTRYIHLDFNEAVSFDETAKACTTISKKSDSSVQSYTATSANEGKTLIFEITDRLSLDEAYVLDIPFIYNESKTKFLYDISVDISFTKYWDDDFESYEQTADLDSKYVRSTGDGGTMDAFTKLENCGLEIDSETGNKKMKISATGTDSGVWIKKDNWGVHGNGPKKYYTLEADFEIIQTTSDVWMCYLTHYEHYRIYSMYFYNWGVNFKKNAVMKNREYANAMVNNGEAVADNKMTIAVSTYETGNTDAPDGINIFWDDKAVLSDTGSLAFTSYNPSFYGFLKTYGSSAYYVDNLKLYKPTIVTATGDAFNYEAPGELYIKGTLESGNTVYVDLEDESFEKVTTVYEWYRGNDLDAPLTASEKWEKLDNSAKSYAVTETDTAYYIVCNVKRTLALTSEENLTLFELTTHPLLAPYAPECKSLSLTYTKGETSASLKADYEYYDANADEENGTVILWEESADNTSWTPLSEATDTLDVTDVINKYIRCTVTVKNDGKKGDEAIAVSEINILPFEPTVTSVSISGTASAGSLLQATYKYFDANGDKEEGTEFVWYKKYGTTEAVVAQGSLAYAVQSSDEGYSIGFKVIPKTAVYPSGTTEYRSNEIAIPVPSSSPAGGSSGTSSFGGSYTATTQPATKDDESEDNKKVLEALEESTKPPFADIENHWAQNEITALYKDGIVNGRGDGFEPDAMITRAEWITLLLRGIEEKASSKYKGVFDDVKEGEWYAGAIEKAYSLKLVSGDGKSFNPNGAITREQMAKMAVLVYEYKNGEIKDSRAVEFTDKDAMSDWAEEYIGKAVGAGLMNGVTESEFSFSSSATRAQACVLLSRIIDSLK